MPSTDNPEVLARYIFNRKHYRPSDHTVKHNAFLPNKDGKTSVFHIFGLEEQEIWEIGDREVAPARQKPVLGRADIEQIEVTKLNLSVIDDESPSKHANIVGWPEDDDEREEKAKRMSLAVELAESAQLYLKT